MSLVTSRGLCVLTILMLSASVVSVRAADAPAKPVPEGFSLVEDDVWYELADEPHHHFFRANAAYLNRDFKSASVAIRKGAAMLKLAVALAVDEPKKLLQASVFELTVLSGEVAGGKLRSVKTMHRIFGRAHYALAEYNQQAAKMHLAKQEGEKAAQHLRAAAHDLEHGLAWMRDEVQPDTTAIIEQAHGLSSSTDGGKFMEELTRVIEGITQEIHRLGRETVPPSPPAPK